MNLAGEIQVHTIVRVKQLPNGDALAYPIADPTKVSIGAFEDCLEEQRLYLEEYLGTVAPGVLESFFIPETASLKHVTVTLTREELPAKLERDLQIDFACLLLPEGQNFWVAVLALGETFFVHKGEVIDDVIKTETQRLVAAAAKSSFEFLKLLPPKSERIEHLKLQIDRLRKNAAAQESRKKEQEQELRKRQEETLLEVGTPLTEGKFSTAPLLAREREMKLFASLLDSNTRNCVLLGGPEHSGKTAILHAWFSSAAKAGRTVRVYATSAAQLVAGMSGFGQWQERLKRVLDAAEGLDAVLYFDNLAELLAEKIEDGGIDLAGSMKRYLESGRVRVVGELRDDQTETTQARNTPFLGLFTRVRVDAMSSTNALEALKARVEHDRKHSPDRPTLADEALQPLIDLAERYQPYKAFPGKAIRLYDDLRMVSEAADPTRATIINRDRLFELFSQQSGVPAFLLRDDKALRIEDVRAALAKRVVGQFDAIQKVAQTVGIIKAGLQPHGKPLATFLFVGPTGVGKTEVARALASYLFGSQDRMVRFDMSEFMDGEAAERLIHGTGRTEGLLTRRVREQPFCVLLLDEIEKAHSAVFDLLLQVCGEGRLTDARGRTAYFHNAIIILTSNLGAAENKPSVGFGQNEAAAERHYQKQIQATFRPEFVNRIDRVVVFQPLTREQIYSIAKMAIDRLRYRLGFSQTSTSLVVSDAAIGYLAEQGFSDRYGARALRRFLEDSLVAPVASFLTTEPSLRDATILVTTKSEPEPNALRHKQFSELRLSLNRRASRSISQGVEAVRAISSIRFSSATWMAHDRVRRVSEQIEFLVSQMTVGRRGANSSSKSGWNNADPDLGEMQREHHRISTLWVALTGVYQEIVAAEEMALAALLNGEEVSSLSQDVRTLEQEFYRAIAPVMFCLEPQRDTITLLVQSIEHQEALEEWLLSLFSAADARKWIVTVQLYEGGDFEQPASDKWSSPITSDIQLSLVLGKLPDARSARVAVTGTNAGVYLAFEHGLHQLQGGSLERSPLHLWVKHLALRELTPSDVVKPEARPLPNQALQDMLKLPIKRTIDVDRGTAHCGFREVLFEIDEGMLSEIETLAVFHAIMGEADENDISDALDGVLDLAANSTVADDDIPF